MSAFEKAIRNIETNLLKVHQSIASHDEQLYNLQQAGIKTQSQICGLSKIEMEEALEKIGKLEKENISLSKKQNIQEKTIKFLVKEMDDLSNVRSELKDIKRTSTPVHADFNTVPADLTKNLIQNMNPDEQVQIILGIRHNNEYLKSQLDNICANNTKTEEKLKQVLEENERLKDQIRALTEQPVKDDIEPGKKPPVNLEKTKGSEVLNAKAKLEINTKVKRRKSLQLEHSQATNVNVNVIGKVVD